MNDKIGKILRLIAIVLIGITSVMNILGGAGTTCAAFFTRDYPSMAALVDYQWLYQAFVIVTAILGIAGVWATATLARSKEHAYRNAVILLALGTIVGAIHLYASLALRGKAVPANIKLYANALTLLYFLLLRLPGIRDRVDFSEPVSQNETGMGAGVASIVTGIFILTTPIWLGSSHIYQGENWVNVLQMPLFIGGTILTLVGLTLVLKVVLQLFPREIQSAKLKLPANRSG